MPTFNHFAEKLAPSKQDFVPRDKTAKNLANWFRSLFRRKSENDAAAPIVQKRLHQSVSEPLKSPYPRLAGGKNLVKINNNTTRRSLTLEGHHRAGETIEVDEDDSEMFSGAGSASGKGVSDDDSSEKDGFSRDDFGTFI